MSTLTKFSHSCVRFDDGDRSLVIDPGVFSEVDAALDGAGGVLITHEHPDHINVDAVRAAAKADPRLRIWAPPNLAAALELGEQSVAVAPGETFEAAGFGIEVFGGQHALIHPTVPVVQNNCYLVDDAVYHPGDSYVVPTEPVRLLLLPLNAPWAKLAETVDFAVSVRAPRAIQIHDALINAAGFGLYEANVTRIAGQHGVAYTHADPHSSLDI